MTDTHRSCARGCTVARRHLAACPDQDQCRGCEPREAEHGQLCYGCHKRLVDHLERANGQADLLRVMSSMVGECEPLPLTTAAKPLRWRVSSDEVLRTMYARAGALSFEASEPIRVGCMDSEQAITDRLSLWVMHLVNDYRMPDPDGGSMGAWLVRHIERLEARESIGDELEQFCEVMSQAHSLAPWREQVAHLRGIPCPECHATSLAMYGGESDVTCMRCRATMSKERYGIWTRMLADEHSEARA